MGQQVQDGKNRCESAKLINSKGKNKIKLAEQSGSVTIETSTNFNLLHHGQAHLQPDGPTEVDGLMLHDFHLPGLNTIRQAHL